MARAHTRRRRLVTEEHGLIFLEHALLFGVIAGILLFTLVAFGEGVRAALADLERQMPFLSGPIDGGSSPGSGPAAPAPSAAGGQPAGPAAPAPAVPSHPAERTQFAGVPQGPVPRGGRVRPLDERDARASMTSEVAGSAVYVAGSTDLSAQLRLP